MISQDLFAPVTPWPLPAPEACAFYHSMTYKDGSSVSGPWDIRGYFDGYIGHYPIMGKTLLDVGTASGFLAFAAEQAGATVTALEGLHVSEYHQLHFAGKPYHTARAASDRDKEPWFNTLKNSFWYGWHKNNSKVEMVYAPLTTLPYWDRSFDVVLAGAILEHLSDPVSVIWSLTRLAKEAVIIGFTPVVIDDNQYMTTANSWDSPQQDYTWWTLSSGLYRRIFANVGFEMELLPATAMAGGIPHERPTIVARRIRT